ncbi:MAG: hypothetical protein IJG81_05155 [Muribaculaceae bacterium]|nr:hypothetical protein [Muribaculaceae bacterium]
MIMRVYILLIFICLTALFTFAQGDDQEVRVVGDKNYNNATLIYDGIDVSNYQKDINWEATASDPNIKYVYIKATEGATHKQHRYRYNLENARKHGVKVGSYHFLRTSTSIQSQFNNFISLVKREEQDLVPLLDVETREGWTIKQLQDSVMKFAILLEEHFGCKPMIYTSSSYFNNYLGASFAGYPLFIARYSKSEPQLYFGAKWILWQFSDRGRIDGIDAMVDLSRFNRGCSIKDIAYRTIKPSKPRRNNGDVPRPKVKHEEKPYVPYPRQKQNLNTPKTKEEKEIQKRGEEAARKRQEMEQKRLEEERKAQEKQRKEDEKKRKEIEKRQKEIEKRRAAEEKKRLEEEKKRQEQELKRQREEAKQKAREQAQNRMKNEKQSAAHNQQDAAAQQEQQRRAALEQAKQERLDQQQSSASTQHTSTSSTSKPKYIPKGNNQSSADNETIKYNRHKK